MRQFLRKGHGQAEPVGERVIWGLLRNSAG